MMIYPVTIQYTINIRKIKYSYHR